MAPTAYERYAPFIQQYIYRKGWQDLREVQVESCQAILDTDKHVIIASGTASGKTEAAFFPILTQLEQKPAHSISVIYISPLKALINDQFQRLTELLEEQDIPVWPWHGDISQSRKKKAVTVNRGILQITPEALEAMLIRHPEYVRAMFADLRYIIIDELHALMGDDRGLQILCQITRLERLAKCEPRRIGLSATLNDYTPAMAFLSAGSTRETLAVGTGQHKRTIKLLSDCIKLPDSRDKAAYDAAFAQYRMAIYKTCHRSKCLIFTNSRNDAETTIADLRKISEKLGHPDIFHVHHGNVSSALRQEAEEALRQSNGPSVAAATLTLELGIDIGDLDFTMQLGAPFSCSSFVQRLGRSGRRTGVSKMMFLSTREECSEKTVSALPWDLLRSIAIIQLYAEERWVEPSEVKKKPYSLLIHQTLSTLMVHGELSPGDLAREVLTLPIFRDTITGEEYKSILRKLLEKETVQRLENGNLIVGTTGERMANHYSFYAVFREEDSYTVIAHDGRIGTLNHCPAPEEIFTLAGSAWKVKSVDDKKKQVFVEKTREMKLVSWGGTGGDVHEKILRRMRQVLKEDTIYGYLQPGAVEALKNARALARSLGILDRDILLLHGNTLLLFPWCGTREVRTIARLLTCGLKDALDIYAVTRSFYYLQVTTGLPLDVFFQRLSWLQVDAEDPEVVLPADQIPRFDKFDYLVPDALLRRAFLHNQCDVPGALEILKHMKPPTNP